MILVNFLGMSGSAGSCGVTGAGSDARDGVWIGWKEVVCQFRPFQMAQ